MPIGDHWVIDQQNRIGFVMIDSGGNEVTGLTLSGNISKNGAAAAAMAGAFSEISGMTGHYNYLSSQAEADTVGIVNIEVTAAGAIQQNLEYNVEERTPDVTFWQYRVTDMPGGGGNPIQGVYVWVIRTNDPNGLVIWDGFTDVDGFAVDGMGRDPLVPLGTNYFWKWKPGFADDDNPDIEVVV